MERGIGLDRVDHLIIARPDLATGVDEIERLCGVRPAIGGRHPDWGSHNALLSLGPRTYLEVIAPDPESAVPPEKRPSVFTRPGTNLVNGWIANQSDIAGALALLSDHGCRMGEPVHGRRALPDGRVLSWTLTDPSVTLFDASGGRLDLWGSTAPGEFPWTLVTGNVTALRGTTATLVVDNHPSRLEPNLDALLLIDDVQLGP